MTTTAAYGTLPSARGRGVERELKSSRERESGMCREREHPTYHAIE